MVGYHIFHTIFLYWLHIGSPFLFSALKDVMWLGIVWWALFVWRKFWWLFIKTWQKTLIIFSLLLIRSVLRSWIQGDSWSMILVGFKYDLYPLFLLLSGIFLWFMMEQWWKQKQKWMLWKYIWFLMAFVLFWWLLMQIGKILIPDFFSWLGYGPVGDYIMWAKPPLYYRTWPWGWMRLQGLFSGPNNYGYFLVSFFSVIVYGIFWWMLWWSQMSHEIRWRKMKSDEEHLLWVTLWLKNIGFWSNSSFFALRSLLFLLYFVSLIRTFSRGVLVGVGVQIFFFIWFMKKSRKKQLVWLSIFGFLVMIWLSIRKWWSTVLHFQAWMDGIDAFLHNPWWYGLGSAGPAIHYEGVYLPENHYLQLLLDIGIPGFLLWMGVLRNIWKKNKELRVQSSELRQLENKHWNDNTMTNSWIIFDDQLVLFLFWLGFLGLLVEGLFLHVLEDSMVNYLFLVPFGIMIGKFSAKKLAKW